MTLGRLLRILWGRRLFVLTPMVCTLIGGLVVVLTFSPRYEATTRVIFDVIKPDPVTGFRVNDKLYDAYVSSQINMLRSDDVTGRVVEAMGWLENPDMVASWQAAPDKGDDLRRWVGRRLAAGIGADMVPETNVLEITFQSTTPDLARLVADNIRTSYIEANIAQTRDTARATATNLSAQAERERERLVELQGVKANLERETGIMMANSGGTLDDLRALQAARAVTIPAEKSRSTVRDDSQALRGQLQNIESSIAAASRTLGPNNPIMIEMNHRRDFVAAQLAGRRPADPVADQTMRRLQAVTALARASSDRLSTVSDKTLALDLVQDEIKRRRQLFDKVSARSAQLVEISNVSDANLTPIGNTTVKRTPVFPNLGLVLGGCGVLGLAIGALLAFIIEAMGRRVRCPEDLRNAIETPTLGVLLAISWIEAPRPKVEKAGRSRFGRKPKPVGGKVELAA
jgi:uncharacterized protein involved in exopolysaccharide biosynthesis